MLKNLSWNNIFLSFQVFFSNLKLFWTQSYSEGVWDNTRSCLRVKP